MHFDYLIVLVFSAVGLAFVFANLILASILRPARKGSQGLETYECGEIAIGDAWVTFDIRYYTVALVYVIFAVEIAFLFPWAVTLKDAHAGIGPAAGAGIGALALVEGVVFILILFLGLAYVWAKGDLDWVMSYSAPAYRPTAAVGRPAPRVTELDLEAQRLEEVRKKEAAAAAAGDAA
jgi:NADH-quinone oxidoreductase subunit A